MQRNIRQAGFTIVELLIVIVVISLLAAIAIFGYNGIQRQASNVEIASNIKAYQKVLIEYAIENGQYPIVNGSACLGEGYEVTCGWSEDNPTFNNEIRPYFNGADTLPVVSNKSLLYDSEPRAGAGYKDDWDNTLDGEPYPWGIDYIIDGYEPCPLQPNAVYAPSGWPDFITSRTPDYSERNNTGTTYCRLLLPDPSKV